VIDSCPGLTSGWPWADSGFTGNTETTSDLFQRPVEPDGCWPSASPRGTSVAARLHRPSTQQVSVAYITHPNLFRVMRRIAMHSISTHGIFVHGIFVQPDRCARTYRAQNYQRRVINEGDAGSRPFGARFAEGESYVDLGCGEPFCSGPISPCARRSSVIEASSAARSLSMKKCPPGRIRCRNALEV
jgi:hypothetical protein